MGRSAYAEQAFHPPPRHVTVIHFDQAFREALDVTKMIIFTMSIDAIEAYAEELAAMPAHERVFNPSRLHYAWMDEEE